MSTRKLYYLVVNVCKVLVFCGFYYYSLIVDQDPDKPRDANKGIISASLFAFQQVLVGIFLFYMVLTKQPERYWSGMNYCQVVWHYAMMIAIICQVPIESGVLNCQRFFNFCLLTLIEQITFVIVFPPPVIHQMVTVLISAFHICYRTHYYVVLAKDYQLLYRTNAFEVLSFLLIIFLFLGVMIRYRVAPLLSQLELEDGPCFYDNTERYKQIMKRAKVTTIQNVRKNERI